MAQTQKIIIITAPSGAGKTSIIKYLLAHNKQLVFSVSATTRLPRANEENGKDYYFISTEAFKNKIANEEFVEWEMVYQGNYYGTMKSELERIWKEGKTPLLDIDVEGAIHVQQQYKENSFSIFIKPPDMDELKNRLQRRGTENEASLNNRIQKATHEMSLQLNFDHLITNDDLQVACEETFKIIEKCIGE